MNDATKGQTGKNSKTNNVMCITLRLRGSWTLVTFTFNRTQLFYKSAKWRAQLALRADVPTRSTCSTFPRNEEYFTDPKIKKLKFCTSYVFKGTNFNFRP